MGPKLVDYLKYETEDTGIAWITFNRPERRNALMGNSQENSTVAKVGEYMRAADDDPDVRVIVLTGEGQGVPTSSVSIFSTGSPNSTGIYR